MKHGTKLKIKNYKNLGNKIDNYTFVEVRWL